MEGIFAKFEPRAYPFRFAGRIHVDLLAGGTPSDPNVAEAWIRSRGMKDGFKAKMLADAVEEVMRERGVSTDEAVSEVARNRHLSGFKRDPTRGLYYEGRQLKAALKEAGSVSADAGKIKPRGYGETNSRKGIISFLAERVFVIEGPLYLQTDNGDPIMEPTEINQSFVHTFRGSGIQYTEVVHDCEFDFTVETDHKFTEQEWAMLWLTAQREGIGAMRSQGYGRFTLIKWDAVNAKGALKAVAA
jgi:hypothetical protein